MTAQNDLDRTLGAWFGAEAAPAVPPEPLARIIESTRGQRPRPSVVAGIGSHAVGAGPTSGAIGRAASLRPALVIALVALMVLALAGGALLVGGRLVAPPPLPIGNVPQRARVCTRSVDADARVRCSRRSPTVGCSPSATATRGARGRGLRPGDRRLGDAGTDGVGRPAGRRIGRSAAGRTSPARR